MSDEHEGITTALYELDGAIRNVATDVVVGVANWSREHQREQTAATILAVMWANEPDPYGRKAQLVTVAVELADALRAELAKGGG